MPAYTEWTESRPNCMPYCRLMPTGSSSSADFETEHVIARNNQRHNLHLELYRKTECLPDGSLPPLSVIATARLDTPLDYIYTTAPHANARTSRPELEFAYRGS